MGMITSVETTERGLEVAREVQEISPGSHWVLSRRHQWHLASTWKHLCPARHQSTEFGCS